MKYAKKMVLISPDNLQKDDNHLLDGVGKQVSEFEQELRRLSSNTSKSPEEALQLYHQLFSRYLHLDQEKNLPKPVVIKQDPSVDKEPTTLQDDETSNTEQKQKDQWALERLIQTLPKSKREKAALFALYLKSSKMVNIGPDGEVILNGNHIEKSNIIDLINDFTRDRPKLPPPVGVVEMAQFLKKTNVPREYIGNPNRWKIINELPSTDKKSTYLNRSVLEDSDNFRTPTSSNRELIETYPKKLKAKLTYTPWK